MPNIDIASLWLGPCSFSVMEFLIVLVRFLVLVWGPDPPIFCLTFIFNPSFINCDVKCCIAPPGPELGVVAGEDMGVVMVDPEVIEDSVGLAIGGITLIIGGYKHKNQH